MTTATALLLLLVRVVVSSDCWLDWSVEQTSQFAADFVDGMQSAAVTKSIDRHAIAMRHVLFMNSDDSTPNPTYCLSRS
jgi:hypothetical protein